MRGWGEGIEQKGKRTHGRGQQWGHGWGKGRIRGLNGNGKNTIKIKFKKAFSFTFKIWDFFLKMCHYIHLGLIKACTQYMCNS